MQSFAKVFFSNRSLKFNTKIHRKCNSSAIKETLFWEWFWSKIRIMFVSWSMVKSALCDNYNILTKEQNKSYIKMNLFSSWKFYWKKDKMRLTIKEYHCIFSYFSYTPGWTAWEELPLFKCYKRTSWDVCTIKVTVCQ